MTCVVSETRMLLVKESRPQELWKLPGGKIEKSDRDIIAAAIREVLEETGIQLFSEEVKLWSKQRRVDGIYYPYFCVAWVSEEKLETRLNITKENGQQIKTGLFDREEVSMMMDLLDRHRSFIQEVEMVQD